MSTSLLRIPAIPSPSQVEHSTFVSSSRECTVSLKRMREGRFVDDTDTIAVETDLLIQVKNHSDEILSRTPGDDLNLVMGNLFCRGLISSSNEVERRAFIYENPTRVEITIQKPLAEPFIAKESPGHISPALLFALKNTFEHRQNLFRHTGATHAAALFSEDGALLAYGEDVGRHNAFDKAIGRALLEGTLAKASIGMLSSRIALAMATKATKAGLSLLCGFSAATSSGISHAQKHGMTLVGRLRKKTFNVYANPERLKERMSCRYS